MADILQALGFQVNPRTHRAPCVLHGGRNSTAFSWTESGQWFCHNCGFGGDRFELVKRVKNCGFRDALEFVARLAGVEVSDDRQSRAEINRQIRLQNAAKKLTQIEREIRWQYAGELRDLYQIRVLAGERLGALHSGAGERFPGESEIQWRALSFVSDNLPTVSAGYQIIAFGNQEARARFALMPDDRHRMAHEALEATYILDDQSRVVEVVYE